MKKRYLSLLGSTGSIGKNAIEIAKHLGNDRVEVVALAARSNAALLEAQAKELKPAMVAILDEKEGRELKKKLPGIRVEVGPEGILEAAVYERADLVLNAIVGTQGLKPTVSAILAKKDIALANKEALVSGGSLMMDLAKAQGVSIIPVDSEHSAIFQCLKGEKSSFVRRLIITASGGPFRTKTFEELKYITKEEALCHPTWSMGHKITIDSSTLMNKGLEVIEAHHLFGLPLDQIEVVIHPQSVIHSMVEFKDGSMLSQMSRPTMLVPIQYAITYPEREEGLLEPFDFTKHNRLDFEKPDMEKFRCLSLAFQAAKRGGSAPCFLNAANEVLVGRFLKNEIGWLDIAGKLSRLLDVHPVQRVECIEDVIEVDSEARVRAAEV
ncbi:1-deoxy-D-xylulose-5-phosphate reductoisomerase [Estrella lausannensis]|uniref:1-deoxy-D-xylulose 5-phosphate reductoisomerase n=1 Tax=Estrella lausannensis TaxID=483423 RepID=A0A0H5DT84_9BACT|nr:1-deoxy-D-xylulose-5-phosphate reductoisomerase [Estrella lausannensis]CRX39039.1 1-deoxy-D-xylulose 5-phosphate reductoisomerase [Estrella lausannensis]